MVNPVQAKFFHHLYDVIVLLGGDPEIANILHQPDAITEEDVERVRSLGFKLIDATKDRLGSINTRASKNPGF